MALTNPNAAGNTAGATLGSLTHALAHVRDTVADIASLPSGTAAELLAAGYPDGSRLVVIGDTSGHAAGTVHALSGTTWSPTAEGPLVWRLVGTADVRQRLLEAGGIDYSEPRDRRGPAYTITSADYGYVIIANADVTLPVVPAGDDLVRVDVWAFAALNLVAASGALITGETAVPDNGVTSLIVASTNGTATAWRVAP